MLLFRLRKIFKTWSKTRCCFFFLMALFVLLFVFLISFWIFVIQNLNSSGSYMFKVNNRNTRARCEICSKLTERHLKDAIGFILVSLLLTLRILHLWFSFSIVNFEQVNVGWEWCGQPWTNVKLQMALSVNMYLNSSLCGEGKW